MTTECGKEKQIPLRRQPFFVLIVPSLFCTVCKGKLFPNIDIEGGSFEEVAAVSDKHCQLLCTAHPRCTYFSFAR